MNYRTILVGFLAVVVIGWPKLCPAESKPEKAAGAHQRAVAAFAKGHLEDAVSEAVMATTLDPKALYFFTAARLYFAKDDLRLAAMYAGKAAASEGRTESIATAEKKKLISEVKQREDSILANMARSCPPTASREDLVAISKVVPESGAKLLDLFERQQMCFLAVFPELPKPVRLAQDGRESVPGEAGAYIVYPGKAEVRAAAHPAFEVDLTGDPGKRVTFRPRGEPWMQGTISLKGTPPMAQIKLDGRKVALQDSSFSVSPHIDHRLVVYAPGRQRFKSEKFSVPFGGTSTLEIRSMKKRSWVPWVLMGMGAVGVGVGGYFMYDGSTAATDFDSGLQTNSNDLVLNVGSDNAMVRQDDANTAWNRGLGGLISGGTLLLSGVIWMLIEDTSPPEWRE